VKRLILPLIIFALVFAGIAYFWRLNSPVKDEELPTYKMVQKLDALLNRAPYNPDDYKSGIFDCSNESALLYDFLTAHGYNCTAVIGVKFDRKLFSVVFHAWVIAEKEGKKMRVDASMKEVMYQKYFKNYFVLAHFKSLLMLQILATLCFFPNEWNY